MTIDPDPFRHEYDPATLESIRPLGHGFEMLTTPRFQEMFLHARYEGFMATLVGVMSRSHCLFIDVGAHHGFFSLVAATGNPDLEILAFEPIPQTHDILGRNFAANGLAPSGALRKAVSNRPGTSLLHLSRASDNCGFYPHPAAPPIARIEVETVTIDQVLVGRAPCPTLIKIDTDGHEIAVLAGMAETLDRFREVKLFVELNPKMQRIAGYGPDELLTDLHRRGFETFLLDEAARRPYRLRTSSDWSRLMSNPEGYVNLYCCPKRTSLSVGFVSQSAALAGAERSLIELVSELIEDHGAMCTVLVPDEGPLVVPLQEAGASVLTASYEWWCDIKPEAGGAPTPETELVARLGPSILRLLGEPYAELLRIDPDVLVTQTIAIPWGACLAEMLGKPHVWHLCEYPDEDHGFRFVLPRDEVIEVVRSTSAHVFTATDGIRESLFPYEADGFCSTLYRHVEEPRTRQPNLSARLPAAPGVVRIGVFGSLCAAKGQDLVVQAVARLVEKGRRVELFLVGPHHWDFPYKLEKLIERRELEGVVHLPGPVDDVFPMLRSMDVVVVGSRRDAFSRATVEAMVAGRAVVYPRLGGPAEYMRDGITGLGYDPEDVDGMADAIDRLVLDASLRHRLGSQARKHARATFSRERYGGAAARTLRELRGARGSHHRLTSRCWWAPLVPWLVQAAQAAERRELEASTHRLAQAHRRESDELNRRLERVQGYLDALLGSATWRIALWLRQPFDRLAPFATRRRDFLKEFILRRHRRSDDSPTPLPRAVGSGRDRPRKGVSRER